ncbi:MAG TPA: hypothetical protein VEY70_07195 [Metabacillus sp.]|nr:hypothetical protein [Metabacillus sp.]
MVDIAQVILNEENTQTVIIRLNMDINTIKEKVNLVVSLVRTAVNMKSLKDCFNAILFCTH